MTNNMLFARLAPVVVGLWVLLGLASIIDDWFSRHWISPLGLGFLLSLAVALVMRLLGKPLITTDGMKERVAFMAGVLVTTLFFVALNMVQLWLR